MYCSGCGQPVAPGQPVCANCGRPLVQPSLQPEVPPIAAFIPYDRVRRHVQTVAILWLTLSLLGVLAWFIAMPFLGMFFGRGGPGFGPHHLPFPLSLHWMLPLATLLIYGRAALGLVAGIGLLRRERWARNLALVVAILALFKPIFGTALGIYTLWVLLPARSAQEYDAIAAP
jgi:hypothetical protein